MACCESDLRLPFGTPFWRQRALEGTWGSTELVCFSSSQNEPPLYAVVHCEKTAGLCCAGPFVCAAMSAKASSGFGHASERCLTKDNLPVRRVQLGSIRLHQNAA